MAVTESLWRGAVSRRCSVCARPLPPWLVLFCVRVFAVSSSPLLSSARSDGQAALMTPVPVSPVRGGDQRCAVNLQSEGRKRA